MLRESCIIASARSELVPILALRRVAAERPVIQHVHVGLVIAQLLRHQVRHLVENITRRYEISSAQPIGGREFILQKDLLLKLLLVDACELARCHHVVENRSIRVLDATRLVFK